MLVLMVEININGKELNNINSLVSRLLVLYCIDKIFKTSVINESIRYQCTCILPIDVKLSVCITSPIVVSSSISLQ